MNFYIKTLGCKVNWLDSARISTALESVGHYAVTSEEDADTVLINSCTVTAEADRKSHQLANKSLRLDKEVIITGCSPRISQSEWRGSQQLILQDESAIFSHFGVNPDEIPYPIGGRTRYPVAIQQGCDNQCGFCITKFARGKHHSLDSELIVDQIRFAEDQGIQEVVLTGVNLAAWGCQDSNHGEQSRLPELLEKVLRQTSIARIRLSSLGPQYLHNSFFDLFRDSRICDYLHLSVQSASDRVLTEMQRGYSVDHLFSVCERAMLSRPKAALAADMICGYPGEGDLEHRETMTHLEELGFAKLHIFPYSEREGTPAAEDLNQLPISKRKDRAKEMRLLASNLRRKFLLKQMGNRLEVLVEEGGKGWSKNYIRLLVEGEAVGTINTFELTPERLAERGIYEW